MLNNSPLFTPRRQNAFHIRRQTVHSHLLIVCLLFLLTISSVSSKQLVIHFSTFVAQMEARFGPSRKQVALKWQKLLGQVRGLSDREKIAMVNAFFDVQIRYQTDDQLWKKRDYWASPLETLGHGRGDCEDYAIAKYISLRYLGLEDDKLRLIYVKAKMGGVRSTVTQAHMVLGYFSTPTAEPLILDSLISQVLPASQRRDLIPVFSFNGEGIWAQGKGKSSASPTARLSRWRHVLERMKQEGVQW